MRGKGREKGKERGVRRGVGEEEEEEGRKKERRRDRDREMDETAICISFLLMKLFSSPITQATTDMVSIIFTILLL